MEKDKRSFQCTLHNVVYSATVCRDQSHFVVCPICNREELDRLRRELDAIRGHRDSLVRAIVTLKEIKWNEILWTPTNENQNQTKT